MSKEIDGAIIAIDGGGSRTRGILYRDGKIVAETKSGTTRIGSVGVGEACERLINMIKELCEVGEIETQEIDAVSIGVAGAWLPEEKTRTAHLLKTLAREEKITINDLLVTSDAEIALEGALEGENGMIIIVGTGSIGLGKVGKNQLVRCGGWGIELDDEGSGAWIGREGLTAVVRSIDGRGKATKLTDMFVNRYPTINLKQPRTIVSAYSDRAFEYHMITPLVMQCAQDGDEVCLEIIQRAADHLLELPVTLLKYYNTEKVPVALMGGIIEHNTLLCELLKAKVMKDKRFKLIEPKGSALDGAIAMGKEIILESE